MPRPEGRPPGPGDISIPNAPARPLQMRRQRSYRPQVVSMVVRRWMPHPWSVWSARALGDLYGRGISGHAGTASTGASRNGAGASPDPSVGFAGYATPQVFTGWNPAAQKHSGTPFYSGVGGLPNTSVPAGSGSPMDSAMAQIMAGNQ